MEFLTGAVGAGFVIVFFTLGTVCGYCLHGITREPEQIKDTQKIPGQIKDTQTEVPETDRQSVAAFEEEQAAFQRLLAYGPEDVYGMRDSVTEGETDSGS